MIANRTAIGSIFLAQGTIARMSWGERHVSGPKVKGILKTVPETGDRPKSFYRTLQKVYRAPEDQGELNMHRIVVTVLWRLRPFFPKRDLPYLKSPYFSAKSYYLHRISSMNPLFSPRRKLGANVTRNESPQIGACLILSEKRFCRTPKRSIEPPFGFQKGAMERQ